MGIAKSLAIEAEERGYFEFDTFVCDECVGDEFLKSVVRAAVAQPECSYCRRKSQSPIAAPFSVLIKPIADTVHYYFCEPTQAGVPLEGGLSHRFHRNSRSLVRPWVGMPRRSVQRSLRSISRDGLGTVRG
jgi:hypothetical protein